MLLQGHLKGGGRLVSSTRTHKACPLPLVLHLQETVDGEARWAAAISAATTPAVSESVA